jgi:hypothetical protein
MTTTTSTSTTVAVAEPVFSNAEQLALAGFLAGYTGLTRRPTRWTCGSTPPGASSATCACSGPAARTSNASPVIWKPRAGPGQRSPAGCARSPGSTGTRWKKTCWTILRPLMCGVPDWTTTRTPPGWTATNSGERCDGPIFVLPDGGRLDRHGAARIARRVACRAGITKIVGPHTLRHAFITAALDAGVPLRDVQEAASRADPRTTIRYDRGRASLDRHATYLVAAFVAGAAR